MLIKGREIDPTAKLTTCFKSIPDIKEHISLLVKHRSNITGGHDGVIHLIPEAIASLSKKPQREAGLNLMSKTT